MNDFTHVVVIPEDRVIMVDGEAIQFDFPKPDGIRAIQWHEDAEHSHVELANYENAPADVNVVAEYVERFRQEKLRRQQEEEARNLPEDPRVVRMREIKEELRRNDLAWIRPARAKEAGSADANDLALLTILEEIAIDLRAELTLLTEELAAEAIGQEGAAHA